MGGCPQVLKDIVNRDIKYLQKNTWTLAHGADEVAAMGFWAVHVDSMAWSIGLGIVFYLVVRWAALKSNPSTPKGFY